MTTDDRRFAGPDATTGENRLLTGRQRADEARLERSLRPRRLAEYIGQDRVKANLAIFIEAAKARAEQIARDVRGVTNVKNELRITGR